MYMWQKKNVYLTIRMYNNLTNYIYTYCANYTHSFMDKNENKTFRPAQKSR